MPRQPPFSPTFFFVRNKRGANESVGNVELCEKIICSHPPRTLLTEELKVNERRIIQKKLGGNSLPWRVLVPAKCVFTSLTGLVATLGFTEGKCNLCAGLLLES